jgi:hypothetical protein
MVFCTVPFVQVAWQFGVALGELPSSVRINLHSSLRSNYWRFGLFTLSLVEMLIQVLWGVKGYNAPFVQGNKNHLSVPEIKASVK